MEDQRVLDGVVKTAVQDIESLQVCPLPTSGIYLTVSGRDTCYSNNKTDVFDISQVCSFKMIQSIFTDPETYIDKFKKQFAECDPVYSRFERLEEKSLTGEEETQESNTEVEEQKMKMEYFERRLKELEKQVSEKEKELERETKRVEGVSSVNTQLRNELTRKNIRIESLEKEKMLQSKWVQNQLSTKEKELENKSQIARNLTSHIERLEQSVSSKDRQIRSLIKTTEELQIQVESKSKKVTRAKRKRIELGSHITNLEKMLRDKERKLEKKTSKLFSIKKKLKKCESEKKSFKDKTHKLINKFSQITKKYVLKPKKSGNQEMLQKTLLLHSQDRSFQRNREEVPESDETTMCLFEYW
jgi:chromosome segregation ATPase